MAKGTTQIHPLDYVNELMDEKGMSYNDAAYVASSVFALGQAGQEELRELYDRQESEKWDALPQSVKDDQREEFFRGITRQELN